MRSARMLYVLQQQVWEWGSGHRPWGPYRELPLPRLSSTSAVSHVTPVAFLSLNFLNVWTSGSFLFAVCLHVYLCDVNIGPKSLKSGFWLFGVIYS